MRWLLVLLIVPTACAIDETADEGFACETDEDCSVGYLCDRAEGEEFGRCSDDPDEGSCGDMMEDRDNDGFSSMAEGSSCEVPPNLILDCDDTNDDINPAADEICDGIDNDCDQVVDEDNDADEPGVPLEQLCPFQISICLGASVQCDMGEFPPCEAGVGYPAEFERVEMSCDEIDNSCNGEVDEGCD